MPIRSASVKRDCLSDIDIQILEYNRIAVHSTKATQIFVGFGDRNVLLKRLFDTDAAFKAGFDYLQPRDEAGRWAADGSSSRINTGNSDGAVSLATTAAASLADFGEDVLPSLRLPSIFGSIGGATATALEAFGASLGAATAAFGAWFIPLRDGAAGTGDLPGAPDVHYSYNEDARTFSVYTSDDETLFEGNIGADGLIRTEDGQVIGRHVNGSLIIDTTKLLDESDQKSNRETAISAQSQAETETQEKFCPNPMPDIPGFRSLRSLIYQSYINSIVNPSAPLPPTLAIYLSDPKNNRPVSYDNCYEQTGVMVDAKGPGFAKLLRNKFTEYFLDLKFIKQAERQVRAAGARPIIWYVDEPEVAAHLTELFSLSEFSEKGLGRITVINMPLPDEVVKYLDIIEKEILNKIENIEKNKYFYAEFS